MPKDESSKNAILRLSGQILDGREIEVRIAANVESTVKPPTADVISNDDLRRGSAFHATSHASTTGDSTPVQSKVSNWIEDIAMIPQIEPSPQRRSHTPGETLPAIADHRRARIEQLRCDITEQNLRDYFKDYAL